MKGKKPKLFITDMDPDLILALMKTFKVKNDSQLNLIYDAFQVNKRLFNLFFMINSSKYKSGEICREFLQGCISENKEDYLNAINKLYRIYAMIYPKIRQTLHVLMKNRDKIAHAHFGQFKFIKERFSEKARIL